MRRISWVGEEEGEPSWVEEGKGAWVEEGEGAWVEEGEGAWVEEEEAEHHIYYWSRNCLLVLVQVS